MLLTLFYEIDNFCKAFSRFWHRFLLKQGLAKRIKPCGLWLSEIMTLLVNFHMGTVAKWSFSENLENSVDDRGIPNLPFGGISQQSLWQRGIQMITKLKANMANRLMPLMDKLLLRKRAIIETINDELKNMCQIEHSRHRSPINFLVNLFSGLAAYTFFPKKPCLRYAELYQLDFLA